MKKRVECKIIGRVQMVLFRDFTTRNARRSGLVGFVKNDPDGSVSVIAEGEEDDLRAFLKKLEKGPLLARVDRIEAAWKEPIGDFLNSRIVYS
jgi:acylphosphatase